MSSPSILTHVLELVGVPAALGVLRPEEEDTGGEHGEGAEVVEAQHAVPEAQHLRGAQERHEGGVNPRQRDAQRVQLQLGRGRRGLWGRSDAKEARKRGGE